MKTQQQGMALLVVIVMLLMISAISISSIRSNTFHEKMTTSLQDSIRLGQSADNEINNMISAGPTMPATSAAAASSLTNITSGASSATVRRSMAVGFDGANWQHFDITAEAWIDDGDGDVEEFEPGVTHYQGYAILSPAVE